MPSRNASRYGDLEPARSIDAQATRNAAGWPKAADPTASVATAKERQKERRLIRANLRDWPGTVKKRSGRANKFASTAALRPVVGPDSSGHAGANEFAPTNRRASRAAAETRRARRIRAPDTCR